MHNVSTAVEKQARLLDERKPDWFEVVNLETLDQGRNDACVLAQNYGSYTDGLHKLFDMYYRSPVSNGFHGDEDLWSAEQETQEWILQIGKRLIDKRRNQMRDVEPYISNVESTKNNRVQFVCGGHDFDIMLPAGFELCIGKDDFTVGKPDAV